ncbi:hypothetical protein [Gallaecimonas mangrovi]|uniref:hypothetical protein n=1 Tax=Gallaecimonas mangrovi TaxID=2291597 RepID=UPI000E20310A|nr:hypothetical protein [Gallaecimonas mangrovi]
MKLRYLIALATLALAGCSASKPWIVDLGGVCDVGYKYAITAADFSQLRPQLVRDSGCIIETDLTATGNVKPHAIKGYMTIRQALKEAISGTDLEVVKETKDVIHVEKKPA